MADPLDRPPWYPRAFELFIQEFDSDSARLIAIGEFRNREQCSLGCLGSPARWLTFPNGGL